MSKKNVRVSSIWYRLSHQQKKKLKDTCVCRKPDTPIDMKGVFIDDKDVMRCKKCKKRVVG